MNLTDLLSSIKQHGISLVLATIAFIYLYSRITDLEAKYDYCMNERIEDAIHQRDFNRQFEIERRPVAILPEEIKIKRL